MVHIPFPSLDHSSSDATAALKSLDSALACLVIVAGLHDVPIEPSALRQQTSLGERATTLEDVVSHAESFGFFATIVSGRRTMLHQMKLPAILSWSDGGYVVLRAIGRTVKGMRYRLDCPLSGERTISPGTFDREWAGRALEIRRSREFTRKTEAPRLGITQLLSSMPDFWSAIRYVLLLSLVLQAVAIAAPLYLQVAIDTAYPAFDKDLLVVLAIGFGGLAIIDLLAGWLRSLVLVHLTNILSYQVVVNLFRHMMRLPLPWFERRHVGDIVSRFGSTQPVTHLLSNGMLTGFVDGLMALATFGLMIAYSPLLAGIALATLLVYGGIRLLFFQALKTGNVNVIAAVAAEQSAFIESVRGVAATKAFGQEDNRRRLWQARKVVAVNAQIKLGRMTAGFDAVAAFAVAVERVLFVYLAVSMALEGGFTIGMIFAFQAYKQQFIDAGVRLIEAGVNFRILRVHLGRITEIALGKPEQGLKGSATRADMAGGIALAEVRFRYASNERDVLKTLSFSIEPGEMVALTGPSGGGKTTAMKVMMGLLTPTRGRVLVDGRPLPEFSLTGYRKAIASVLQDDVLYAGTLAENIAFFSSHVDLQRVGEAARAAQIDRDIAALPFGYHTPVGDLDDALSAGQKQRILLARALYARPSILFIDEGTANLDRATERQVMEVLAELPITRVIIAHRASVLRYADRVIRIKDGIATEVSPDRRPLAKSRQDPHEQATTNAPVNSR